MVDNRIKSWSRSRTYTIRHGNDKARQFPHFYLLNEDYYYEFERRVALEIRSIPDIEIRGNIVYMFGAKALSLFRSGCSFHFGYKYNGDTDEFVIYAHYAVKGGKSYTKSLCSVRNYDRHEYSLVVVYDKQGYFIEWVIDGETQYSTMIAGKYGRLVKTESMLYSHYIKEIEICNVSVQMDEEDVKYYR